MSQHSDELIERYAMVAHRAFLLRAELDYAWDEMKPAHQDQMRDIARAVLDEAAKPATGSQKMREVKIAVLLGDNGTYAVNPIMKDGFVDWGFMHDCLEDDKGIYAEHTASAIVTARLPEPVVTEVQASSVQLSEA
jgi:hypothetical protein